MLFPPPLFPYVGAYLAVVCLHSYFFALGLHAVHASRCRTVPFCLRSRVALVLLSKPAVNSEVKKACQVPRGHDRGHREQSREEATSAGS